MKDEIIKTHESYAVAGFSRISHGGATPLFGSSIGHNNTIMFRVHTAEEIRSTDLSYDRYFPREQLIEIEMSQTQFAEMITTLNHGVGVPVTLRYFNGKPVDGEPPVENKRAQHRKEFKQKMIKFANTLKEDKNKLKSFLNKPKLSKEDKRLMTLMFDHLTTNIESNIPFFEKMFEEQMDKTVTEAKGEVEAFIDNAVTRTGLETLRNEGKFLMSNNK